MGIKSGEVLWEKASYKTADDLMVLLKNIFGSENQSERFRMELKARRRQPKESLQTLYQDVLRLLTLAYGCSSGGVMDTIGVDAFVDSLGDHELRRQVLQKDCKTLARVLITATKIEAIECTAPADPIISYGPDGMRNERAHVRRACCDC